MLVEINKLMSEKNYEEANKLRQELGTNFGLGFGRGWGMMEGKWHK